MTEWVQQTNSTVTTTALQPASGLSSSDWISLFSAVAMIAVTIALAYYARVAIVEAKEGRRRDSIEKQLEKLYNPMFEILDTAKPVEITADSAAAHGGTPAGKYRWLGAHDDVRSILRNHGHYLRATEHDKIRELLSTEFLPEVPEADHAECLAFIREKREQLAAELKALS